MKRFNQTLVPALILSGAISFSTNNLNAQQQVPPRNKATSEAVNASTLFNEGYNLLQQKKFSEAAKIFEQVLAINPKMRYAHTNLSWAYLETWKV